MTESGLGLPHRLSVRPTGSFQPSSDVPISLQSKSWCSAVYACSKDFVLHNGSGDAMHGVCKGFHVPIDMGVEI